MKGYQTLTAIDGSVTMVGIGVNIYQSSKDMLLNYDIVVN